MRTNTSFHSREGSTAGLAARVVLLMDFAQVRVSHVGVDLGGIDGSVPEKLLDSAVPAQAAVLARVYNNKAWRYYSWGEAGQAEKWFKTARDLLQKNGERDSLDMAEVLNNLALILDDGGDAQVSQAQRLLFRA